MYAVATLDQRTIRLPYAAPRVDLRKRELEEEPLIIALAVLGLVAFAIVLAWGAWCVGANPGYSFSFTFVWPVGFTVKCEK